MTILARSTITRRRRTRVRSAATGPGGERPSGLVGLVAAEAVAGLLGFLVLVHLARSLGPSTFAHLEFAAAVSAWLLVFVRSGIEAVVYREAARRPGLIRPLTDLLIGLKSISAIIGYGLILGLSAGMGQERGSVLAVAGLVLIPSALVADVGARAVGRLGPVALAQGLRALAYAALAMALVAEPGHAVRAAWCAVLAELVGCLVVGTVHTNRFGRPRPRYRRRAWAVLAARGAIASVIRFGRVGLYAWDVLVLGWWASSAMLGEYAAARRVVFAMVALGLVVPGAVAPAIARAWAIGADRARDRLDEVCRWVWSLALPASVGLVLTSDRVMPLLFGPAYHEAGPWLVLVAARLPWVLLASLFPAALVACRLEHAALGLVLTMVLVALVLVPGATASWGPWGAGGAALVVEMMGTAVGWGLLRSQGVAPGYRGAVEAILGCLVMVGVYRALANEPLGLACVTSAAAYALCWLAMTRIAR